MKVRRVVTGHSPAGKAVVASDTEVDGITIGQLGSEFHRLWGGDAVTRTSLRDPAALLPELETKLPGLADHLEPDAPGMHTTDTIDFEYVVSGRVVLELDASQVKVVGMPRPWQAEPPVSRAEQLRHMQEWMASLAGGVVPSPDDGSVEG